MDYTVSMDGTGLERTKASEYYIEHIDAKRPFRKEYHLSIIVGQDSNTLSLRLRKEYTYNIVDVKYLTKRLIKRPIM